MLRKTKIIDAFMWSYEEEAVRLRLDVLQGVVSGFVAVQATNTFRGQDRTVKLLDDKRVKNVVVTIPDGLDSWQSEKWLRDQVLIEAAKLYGTKAKYIISDGDEIPNPEAIKKAQHPTRLMTDYRSFYADWRATDHVLAHQPTIAFLKEYQEVGGACDARWHAKWPESNEWGWHLSSLGDTAAEKLKTFAHTEYDSPEYIDGLGSAKNAMRDFLNRFDLEWTSDVPPKTPEHLLGGKHDQ